MITRILFLTAIWFFLSFITLVFYGIRTKHGNLLISIMWLIVVILAGDVWALYTFGIPNEIAVASVIAFILGVIWILLHRDWNRFGQVAWIMMFIATMTYLTYTAAITAFSPTNAIGFILAVIFFFVECIALFLSLSYAYEALDVLTRFRWRRRFGPFKPVPGYEPKVSLHVPAYNEPVEVLESTLRNLSWLNYSNYEVLVVDNNTPDEKSWKPLADLCRKFGPRFRFVHLDHWPGYKSGALNFALAQTSPDAEIIGIIDADYEVTPDFLRDTVPAFADPEVAFVQTPQDYRGIKLNPFFEAAYHGYKYFFEVSMPSRNEDNAIIFAGTMGLLRKSVLQEIGGWDEWCITEDAEASLRILQRGYKSIYINKSYGRGLIPLTFDGFKKQRFRWCFGGIQILRKHWSALMPWAHLVDPSNCLTFMQRYYYLVGGLQWYNDLLNLFFVFFLIVGGVISQLEIQGLRTLTTPLLVMPVLFLIVSMWRFLWVLRHSLHLNLKDALRAMENFFSLGWAVTLASIQGLIQPQGVFLRTPKSRSRLGFVNALNATRWETLIGLTCGITGVTFTILKPTFATATLGVLLLWEASLFLSAPVYSLASLGEEKPDRVSVQGERPVSENWAAGWVMAGALVLLAVLALIRIMPTPTTLPAYTQFQPPEVPIQRLIIPTRVPLPTEVPRPTATPRLVAPTTTPPIVPSLTPTPIRPTLTPIPSATPVIIIPTSTPMVVPSATPLPTIAPTLTPVPTTIPTQVSTATPTLALPTPTSTFTPTFTPTRLP
ncbi:MAG: glycosyltransferase [Chloroflexi bacterium]|nr:glycosyltransferase [Chloroflexota bacterium]